jgi:hypothetical protein
MSTKRKKVLGTSGPVEVSCSVIPFIISLSRPDIGKEDDDDVDVELIVISEIGWFDTK